MSAAVQIMLPLLLSLLIGAAAPLLGSEAQRDDSRPASRPAAGTPAPRELYQALNALRVDAQRVFYVRNLILRRDIVRISFEDGKLAFLSELDGRIIGAVFTGRGQAVVVPREPAERFSLNRFVGMPLVDQSFSRAYLRFTDRAADELLRQLRAAEAEAIPQPSFAEEWNAVVALLNPWHSLRVLADWLAAEPRPYFYAGVQGDVSGAFDILVDDRADERVLIGQSRWSGGSLFYDVWVAVPHPEDHAEPGDAFEPLRYSVDTAILSDLSLEGDATLELRARRAGERLLTLQLSRNLSVQEVEGSAGRALDFFQNEDLAREDLRRLGNDMLTVILPQATTPGETLRLRVRYAGQVISDAGNRVYFVGERGSWYPHITHTAGFVPYELSFRWPRRLTLVATGTKLEEREEGDWRVGRWRSDLPMPLAGFNLGEYARETVTAGSLRIDLFAYRQLEQAVLERFQRPILLPSLPRTIAPSPRSTPPSMRIILPDPPAPSPAALMKLLGEQVAEAIRFYERLLGPFPFEALSISQIPGSFGQGWPGLLYLSTLSFLSDDQQQRAGLTERSRTHFSEIVPFHEVAHQWWGNVVGTASYRDVWIVEGLANYLALLFAESKRPGALRAWLDRYREDLTTFSKEEGSTPEQAGPLTLGHRLRSSRSPEAFANVVYGKGTWVFHMLRMMLREPGAKNPDARFAALLRTLVENYRFRPLSTEDLESEMEKVMTPAMDLEGSKRMDWFFDQWVRGAGVPSYSVEFTVRPQGEQFVIRGKLKQSGVPDSFVAAVPIYAPRASGRLLLLGTVVASGPETSFQFTSRVRPRRLLIDPDATLLCLLE